jgi:hypothetical protein
VCLGLPDVSLEMLEASEEALTVRTWQRLCLCRRRFSFDTAAILGGLIHFLDGKAGEAGDRMWGWKGERVSPQVREKARDWETLADKLRSASPKVLAHYASGEPVRHDI